MCRIDGRLKKSKEDGENTFKVMHLRYVATARNGSEMIAMTYGSKTSIININDDDRVDIYVVSLY